MNYSYPPQGRHPNQNFYPRSGSPRSNRGGFRNNMNQGPPRYPPPPVSMARPVMIHPPHMNFSRPPHQDFAYQEFLHHNPMNQPSPQMNLSMNPPFNMNIRPSRFIAPLPRSLLPRGGHRGNSQQPQRERPRGMPKSNYLEQPSKRQRIDELQMNGWQTQQQTIINDQNNYNWNNVKINADQQRNDVTKNRLLPLKTSRAMPEAKPVEAALENDLIDKSASEEVIENLETLQKISEILTSAGIDITKLNTEVAANALSPESAESEPEFLLKDLDALKQVDLSEPDSIETGWNASEIIKNFLFIGSGYDRNQRCLVNNPYKLKGEDAFLAERDKFVREKNIKFFLNMAGHPDQQELKGISYPGDAENNQIKSIELNDVDSWAGDSMRKALEEGANFIQQAYYVHVGFKNLLPNVEPVKILVHCVAGVNRSAFVVVWWLVKYLGVYLKDAWNLVVERRDTGVNWVNQTLGGEVDEELEELAKDIELNSSEFYTLDSSLSGNSKHHQHLVETTYNPKSTKPNNNVKSAINLDLLDNSGDTVVFATAANRFPKYFWYRNADLLLNQYYSAHWP